jgi:pyridoxamine 5'-phosphate oxidase family protein
MSVFTKLEVEYLSAQRLARLATASTTGDPDVAVAGYSLDGDGIVTGGLDLTKTVRYRHLKTNPRATVVIDDLAAADPSTPRGIKIKGEATLERHDGSLRILVRAAVIWSWGINQGAPTHFMGSVEKRPAVPA